LVPSFAPISSHRFVSALKKYLSVFDAFVNLAKVFEESLEQIKAVRQVNRAHHLATAEETERGE